MARARHVFLVALVLFNIVVLSYGVAEAPKTASPSNDSAEVDDDYEGVIGTGESGAASPNSVVAGPIGGPVPPGAFDEANKAGAPSAATSSLRHLSAAAGAAATAVPSFFYLQL
ncbi:unnamed protein product [Lupinus luteus]|uniref:Anther-specific protein BCP1 n=1 Tax=Lupinus luteus TaxID=3873 RepID=A0AAV1XVV9_LUPLU